MMFFILILFRFFCGKKHIAHIYKYFAYRISSIHQPSPYFRPPVFFYFGILLTAFLLSSPVSGSWDSGVPCPLPVVRWTLRPKFINWPRRIYWRRSLFRHRWIYASMASARTIVTPRMPFAAIRTCWRAPSPPFCPTLSRAIARYVSYPRHAGVSASTSHSYLIQHPARMTVGWNGMEWDGMV